MGSEEDEKEELSKRGSHTERERDLEWEAEGRRRWVNIGEEDKKMSKR